MNSYDSIRHDGIAFIWLQSCWSTALLTLGVFFSCFQVSDQTSNTLAQSTEINERQVHQNQSEMAQKFLTSSLQKLMSESRCIQQI